MNITWAPKTCLKRTIVVVWAAIVRCARLLLRKHELVVVCPPFPSDANIGDRALAIGAIRGIRKYDNGPIRTITTSTEAVPAFDFRHVRVDARFRDLFMYEGPLLTQLSWISSLRRAKRVYLIGADSVDDTYSASQSAGKLSTMCLCGRLGIPTLIMSFSIRQVNAAFLESVKRLPARVTLVPRDPVSFERLESAGIGNGRLAADLSFLVATDEDIGDDRLRRFFSNDRRVVVGVNFNNRMFPDKVHTNARLEYLSRAFVAFAHSEDVRLLIIPNTRMQKDRFLAAFCRAIVERGGEGHLVDPMPSPEQLKAIIGRCSYLFSCSLHLSLFALSGAVPVTCFPYGGKFEGPLADFDMSDSAILLEDMPMQPDELAETLRCHFSRREDRKARIRKHLPRIVEKALRNVMPG